MNEKQFGNFIKELREEKNLNQGELADALHVHRTAVNKWEKGKAIPINDTLILIADFFSISMDELVAGHRFDKNEKKDIKNNAILSLLKSNRKGKKIRIYITLLTLIILIIFLIYYFFTTFNSIHVYNLYGEGEKYKVKDSLLIVSNEKVYLRLGSITEKETLNNADLNKVSLYVDNGNNTKLLFTGDPNELLVEKRNNMELFNTLNLKKQYDNLYLILNHNDYEERIKITVKKDFQNIGLLFKNDDTNNYNRINKDYYKVNDKFVYDELNDIYTYKDDKNTIVYVNNANIIYITKKGESYDVKYEYSLPANSLFVNKLLKQDIVESKKYFLNNNDSDEALSVFADFKRNYLDKYFSETGV